MRIARFIRPAEDEMIEAAVYYESQVIGLGEKFIETIERALFEIEKNRLCGQKKSIISEGEYLAGSHSAFFMLLMKMSWLLLPLPIREGGLITG